MTVLDNEKLENVSGGFMDPRDVNVPEHDPVPPLEALSFEELVRKVERFENIVKQRPGANKHFQPFKLEMFKFWKEKNPEEYEKHKSEIDAIIGEN